MYKIDNRRIYVSVCNGWKEKLGSEVEIKINAPNQDFVCKSDQPFYKLDHFIPHESCALVFRIQYDAQVQYFDQSPLQKLFTIGWHEYLPDYNGRGVSDQVFNFLANMGPGKTISKEVLWCRNKDDPDHFHIAIQGDLSSESKQIKAKEIAPIAE